MDKKIAWAALFSKTTPEGADLDSAVQALAGVKSIDPAVAEELPRDVLDWAEEFLIDRQYFINQNAGDPRVAMWQQLTEPVASPSSSTPAVRPVTPAPTPPIQRPLSAGPLMDVSVGGGDPTTVAFGGGKTGDASTFPTTAPPSTVIVSRQTPPTQPVEPPPPPANPVRSFAEIQDEARTAAELLREHAAVQDKETPAKRQKRLYAEAAERQRRLDQDAAECARRQGEEEEARKRRIADDAAAAEAQRLADLRLADEKRRLDEEAEERKLKRKEEADERKRQADEAARIARKAAEMAEEEGARTRRIADEATPPPPPRPLIDVADRSIPAITRQILAARPYLRWRDWIIEAYRVIREGSEAERLEKRGGLVHMKNVLESMKRGEGSETLEAQCAFHLERIIQVLESDRDLREPAWFQANFVTGTYAD